MATLRTDRPLPRRIHIIGGEGSGKSTLAARLGSLLGTPVHHLDFTAWVPLTPPAWDTFHPRYMPATRIAVRPLADRQSTLERIATQAEWVTEGKHLVWTAALLSSADQIIWLDHVPFHRAAARILRRATGSTLRESRQRRGLSRYIRASYLRHAAELVMQLLRLARFYVDGRSALPGADQYGRVTRAAIRVALEPYAEKVIQIRTDADLSAMVAEVRARVSG